VVMQDGEKLRKPIFESTHTRFAIRELIT